MSVEGMSRAGFYRFLKSNVSREEDTEVRSAVQQAALQHLVAMATVGLRRN